MCPERLQPGSALLEGLGTSVATLWVVAGSRPTLSVPQASMQFLSLFLFFCTGSQRGLIA